MHQLQPTYHGVHTVTLVHTSLWIVKIKAKLHLENRTVFVKQGARAHVSTATQGSKNHFTGQKNALLFIFILFSMQQKSLHSLALVKVEPRTQWNQHNWIHFESAVQLIKVGIFPVRKEQVNNWELTTIKTVNQAVVWAIFILSSSLQLQPRHHIIMVAVVTNRSVHVCVSTSECGAGSTAELLTQHTRRQMGNVYTLCFQLHGYKLKLSVYKY